MRLATAIIAVMSLLCGAINSPARAADKSYTLVVDRIVMQKTPQSGTWLFCFKVMDGDNEATFHIPNKEYKDDGITIEMNLELTDIQRGAEIKWWMGLDDDEADVCSEKAEDKAEGKLVARLKGSKTFNPKDNWSFTVYWHLKEE